MFKGRGVRIDGVDEGGFQRIWIPLLSKEGVGEEAEDLEGGGGHDCLGSKHRVHILNRETSHVDVLGGPRG